MATKQPTKNDTAQLDTEDVAIDVAANDLVHVGEDTAGYNHYYDRGRDRIVVTDATHEEYTPEDSILVCRRLEADGGAVEEIVNDVDGRLEAYVQYVLARVDDRTWEEVTVDFLDLDALMDGVCH